MKRLLLLAALFLCACTIAGKGVVSDVSAVAPGKGLVIFSTGAAQTSIPFSTRLMLVEGASMKRYDKVAISIDYPFASNFPDMHGHVRTLTLGPGKYYLLPVAGNPAMRTLKTPIYSFEVKPDTIEYIGDIYLDGNTLSLRPDFRERDISYFLDRNPALKSHVIETDPIRLDRYLEGGDANPFKVEGVIWEAPQ